jgi:hypothetical protein
MHIHRKSNAGKLLALIMLAASAPLAPVNAASIIEE